MKYCYKCKQTKDESEFYKNKANKDGLYSECKECHKPMSPEYQHDYYIAHRATLLPKHRYTATISNLRKLIREMKEAK